jgi:phosphoglycerate dehydrogenase-like enzyme
MTRLLLLLNMPEAVRDIYAGHLRAAFPDLRVDVADHHSRVGPYIEDADILVSFGPMLSDLVFEQATRLKWVQALGTGTDGITDRPSLRSGVLVTNMHGIHGDAMSEAALMLMLALCRQLPRSLICQARRTWERFPARLLKGKTVGILGVGAIAETLAPKCRAFGMRVIGISSAPRDVPGFDRMVARDALAEIVPELDFLVLLTPYSPATHRLIDASVLAAMKRSSYVLNLARGGIVDEDALLRALSDGSIAGAALDVFATEPLPPDSPIWSAPNVIVTAHQGGFNDEYPARALPVVEENIRCFLAGEIDRMVNVVRR